MHEGIRPLDIVICHQLDGPTPCSEWPVRQLVEHVVGSTDYLLARRARRRPGEPGLRRSRTTDRAWRRCSMHSHARESCSGGAAGGDRFAELAEPLLATAGVTRSTMMGLPCLLAGR
jgi:hypothetical protein